MNHLIFALMLTVFGGILPSINKEAEKKYFIFSGIINFIIAWLIGYFGMPHMYLFSSGLFVLIAVFAIINSIISGSIIDEWPIGATYTSILLGILFVIFASGWPIFDSTRYRDMIGEVQESNWKKDMHPLDEGHVRLVSKETAKFLGNKVIGEAEGALGSRYEMGEYVIQKFRGEQYWVAPLEFIDFWKWRRFKYSPGFVMVSAEDPSRRPEIFLDYKMKYIPSACFSDNLERKLYNMDYAFKGLTDYTFELDDEERPNPWYVITIHHPEAGFLLQKVDGVVIISPETGELHPNTPDRGYFKPEETPSWVDRIYPEEYVENYIYWSGKYVHGVWNFSKRDVEVPTPYGQDQNDVWLTFGDAGGQNWFTGMTSSSSSDQSLTCFVLIDSRTGQAKKYRLTGANEEAVKDAVDSEFSNFNGQYVATQPILRNINGNLAWVVPVVTADKGILKRITIVNPGNLKVSKGEDFQEALSEYEMTLTGSGFDVALTNSSSIVNVSSANVERWNSTPTKSGVVYYFMISEYPNNIFMVTENTSPEVFVTREGDRISMSFIETTKAIVAVKVFDNESIFVEKANIQKSLESRRDSIQTKTEIRDDAKEFLKEIKDMTPEELLELRKKAEKNKS